MIGEERQEGFVFECSCVYLRICWGGGGGKEQIRRANKFERKGGTRALNLNFWLLGQGQEVRVKSTLWRETERLRHQQLTAWRQMTRLDTMVMSQLSCQAMPAS